jgi:hypothetical protein
MDAAKLALPELRALRAKLQADEDVLSYVRRIAQGRIDLALAEQQQRIGAAAQEKVIGSAANRSTGTARPPRPIEDSSSHPMAVEFDALCDGLGVHRLETLCDQELASMIKTLQRYEGERSSERHQLFAELDLLSAELVRRYRDGSASVDGLLAGDD